MTELRWLLSLCALGVLGWLLLLLTLMFLWGAETNRYPCVTEQVASRTYLRCAIAGD